MITNYATSMLYPLTFTNEILICFINIVSRISGKTEVHKLEIELDVNSEIYPMLKGQYYALVLANSLTSDGNEDFDLFRHTN